MDNTKLQIVLEAQDKVTAELKKVQKELGKLGDEFKSLGGQTTKGASDVVRGLKKIDDQSETTEHNVGKLVGTLQGLGAMRLFRALGALYVVREMGQFLISSVQAASEAEQAQAQLAAVLNSTGRSAEITTQEMIALSQSLQKQTTFGDDAILSAQNLLLTFTKIGKNVLPEATMTVLDMSVAMGQDLKQSAIQLGKALQDPIIGAGALRRVGVNLNESQMELIKTLVESGDVLAAQKIILTELATEFSGSATNAAKTYTGQLQQMQENFGDLKERIGQALLPTIHKLSGGINENIDVMHEQQNAISFVGKVIYSLTHQILGAVKVLALFGDLLMGVGEVAVQGFKTVAQVFLGFGKDISKVGQAVMAIVKGDFKEAASIIDGGSSLFAAIENNTKSSGALFDKYKDRIGNTISEIGKSFKEAAAQSGFVMPTIGTSGAGGTRADGGAGSAIEDLANQLQDAAKSYDSFGETVTDIWLDLTRSHRDATEKSVQQLEKLDGEYKKVKTDGSDAIRTLKDNTKKNLEAISESIAEVNSQMEELQASFDKQKSVDAGNLAGAFIEAERSIAELKEQLVRATDAQDILDIKNQIKAEEEALKRTSDVQKQFATEISEARKFANLSAVEQAIINYQLERQEAQATFNQEMAQLQAERTALEAQREYEKQVLAEKIAERQAETDAKLKEILKEKVAVLEQQKEELELYLVKSQFIISATKQVQDFRQEATRNAVNANKNALAEEVEKYKELERQIRRAASAREEAGVNPKNFSVPRGSRETGGYIAESGMYRLHEGEYVVPRKDTNGGNGGTVVQILGGTYLSTDVAEQIGNMLADKLKVGTKI